MNTKKRIPPTKEKSSKEIANEFYVQVHIFLVLFHLLLISVAHMVQF
jgi:hypothetical protein